MAASPLSGSRVLVAGGAGFIGANFVHRLMRPESGVHVTVLDILSYAGNPANIAMHRDDERFRFVRGDIADADTVEPLVAEADFVVNFAAETHVDRSIKDQKPLIRSNIEGPLTLLNAVRNHPVRRFVQVGTDEVYGEILGDPVTEEAPLKPRNPYSASKAAADGMVLAYRATFDLPVVVTRCSNNYGPYQYPEKMIPLFATNAMDDVPMPVYGTGTNTRDWIHVADHARALELILAAKAEAVEGEIFNIAGGNEYSVLQIAALILKTLGKPEDLVQHVTDRPGHDRRYALDAAKIRERVGFEPERDFESGLEETLNWYRDHADWWRDIKSGAFRQYYREMYESR